MEVHTSLLNNTRLAIMWVTETSTATSTVEYSTNGSHALPLMAHGSTHTYTAGGWKGIIHEASILTGKEREREGEGGFEGDRGLEHTRTNQEPWG